MGLRFIKDIAINYKPEHVLQTLGLQWIKNKLQFLRLSEAASRQCAPGSSVSHRWHPEPPCSIHAIHLRALPQDQILSSPDPDSHVLEEELFKSVRTSVLIRIWC